MSNIYQKASRAKLRFNTNKGDITVEQLWELPLTSKTGFDLDTIAKQVNRELNAVAEESFVQVASNPQKAILTLKLDVLKDVISVLQAENAARVDAAQRKAELTKLTSLLDDKKDEALKGLTVEQLQARIASLGG